MQPARKGLTDCRRHLHPARSRRELAKRAAREHIDPGEEYEISQGLFRFPLDGADSLRQAQVCTAGPAAILAAFRVLRSPACDYSPDAALEILSESAGLCLPERYIGMYGSGMLLDVPSAARCATATRSRR